MPMDKESKSPFLEGIPKMGDKTVDTHLNENAKQMEDSEGGRYGCLSCRPRSIQFFNDVRWHVFWQCVFNFFEGFIVNGVINVVLVALEKRYQLPSSKSGLIASANDFGSIICGVLVGYFVEKRHKPKWMGAGIALMAVGCFVFSLPQFIGDKYTYTVSSDTHDNSSQNLCAAGSKESNCPKYESEDVVANYRIYYALLMIGNIILGIGASPMFTVGLSYIDENCKPKLSSFFISCAFCWAAIGVAVGYIVGGYTLALFVDIDKVNPTTVNLTPQDPQWVGAWWIGPLIALGGFLFVIGPICGYPRRLPNYGEVQKYRTSQAHGGSDELTAQVNFGKSWKDLPKSIFLLIKNPTYVFICFGAAVEALIIGGTATFGTKLMQEKFNIDLTTAGTIMGIITIPGSGGGMLLGGYLVKKFNLQCRGIIRLCAGFMAVAFCFGPFLLATCTSDPIAGLDSLYAGETTKSGLIAECNQGCDCSTEGFEPVCMNNVVYFSPCYAGCTGISTSNGTKRYTNCSCAINTTWSDGTTHPYNDDVVPGLCTGRCVWLYVFAGLFLVVMILTFATMAPGVSALFRCVPDNQRSVGIGVNLLFVRLVGTTPGPILLGAIIDSTCKVWQDTCGIQGSCWIYDKEAMALRTILWFMGLKLCGFLLFVTASCVYKPPPTNDRDVPVTSGSGQTPLRKQPNHDRTIPEISVEDNISRQEPYKAERTVNRETMMSDRL